MRTRLTQKLGIEHPIISAPMGYSVAGRVREIRVAERADEEGDRAESEQEVADEARELGDLARGFLGLLDPGTHLCGRRKDRLDVLDELLGRDAVSGRY